MAQMKAIFKKHLQNRVRKQRAASNVVAAHHAAIDRALERELAIDRQLGNDLRDAIIAEQQAHQRAIDHHDELRAAFAAVRNRLDNVQHNINRVHQALQQERHRQQQAAILVQQQAAIAAHQAAFDHHQALQQAHRDQVLQQAVDARENGTSDDEWLVAYEYENEEWEDEGV